MVFIRLLWFGDGQGPASVVEFFGASALPELKKLKELKPFFDHFRNKHARLLASAGSLFSKYFILFPVFQHPSPMAVNFIFRLNSSGL
jgi:hypothetical protein